MELSPEDKYLLFKAQMDADRKALDAQKASHEVQRLSLEMEYRYGLLAEGSTIDPRTATTRNSIGTRNLNGRVTTDTLLMAINGSG
tara:strand:- start:273 stop:530 length:258 start_codon:yes stop_codon:yes gene_type:complete